MFGPFLAVMLLFGGFVLENSSRIFLEKVFGLVLTIPVMTKNYFIYTFGPTVDATYLRGSGFVNFVDHWCYVLRHFNLPVGFA